MDFLKFTRGEYLTGTSQFAVQFDQGLNKFKINIMNCPYYEQGNIAVRGAEQGGTGSTGNYFYINKKSGMILCDLQPADFWFKKLGF